MPVPEPLRPALRAELDALARGERPDLMTWVEAYGPSGARLVPQPDDVWTHPDTEVRVRSDGSAWGVVPLWTEQEGPSDLSAEFEVDDRGRVSLRDVRLM